MSDYIWIVYRCIHDYDSYYRESVKAFPSEESAWEFAETISEKHRQWVRIKKMSQSKRGRRESLSDVLTDELDGQVYLELCSLDPSYGPEDWVDTRFTYHVEKVKYEIA